MRQQQALAQREGRPSDAVTLWQARSRASLLVEREGLGAFRWLVLASPGLPEPPFLRAAREAERSGAERAGR
jgi:hypothetical protein